MAERQHSFVLLLRLGINSIVSYSPLVGWLLPLHVKVVDESDHLLGVKVSIEASSARYSIEWSLRPYG